MAVVILIVVGVIGVLIYRAITEKAEREDQLRKMEEEKEAKRIREEQENELQQRKIQEEKREKAAFEKKQQELVKQYANSPLLKEIIDCLCSRDGQRELPLEITVENRMVYVPYVINFTFSEHRIADLPKTNGEASFAELSKTGIPVWALATAINQALGDEYEEDAVIYNMVILKLKTTRSF